MEKLAFLTFLAFMAPLHTCAQWHDCFWFLPDSTTLVFTPGSTQLPIVSHISFPGYYSNGSSGNVNSFADSSGIPLGFICGTQLAIT